MEIKRKIVNLRSISSLSKLTHLIFLVFLFMFEIVPTSSIQDAQYIVVAGFQRANSQFIERSVYALQYRPLAEQAQALQDLRTTLTTFQQEQSLLWTNSDLEVQGFLNQAQPDYLSIVTSAQSVLAHPSSSTNQLQLNIILSYDRGFFSTMNSLVLFLEQKVETQRLQLLLIKVGLIGICIVTMLFLMFYQHHLYFPKRKANSYNNLKRNTS